MLQTARTVLRLIKPKDDEDLLNMFFEPDTFKYIGPLADKSRSEYLVFLESRRQQIRLGTGTYWVGRLKATNELVGAINLNPFRSTGKMQLGFQIKRQFWNQGFAVEMAGVVLTYGQEILGLEEIYGYYEKENIASGKILAKLGFQENGRKSFAPGDPELEIVVCKREKTIDQNSESNLNV